tara:strand:- start:105 stop:617 length:513 start_codon:yes stop_codon:yes gene_type:complete
MFQNKVFLSLGSNVGNWKVNFNSCLLELSKIGNLKAIGNIYLSKPYGMKLQNDFYNTALEIETKNSPIQLIDNIKLIEKKLHKNKILKNGPRRIDIDIIFYDSLKIFYNNLIIPHPRIKERDFVLFPLYDINPFLCHPVSRKSIKKLKQEIKTIYIKKKFTQPKDLFVIH